jgi:hypothetical protein
MVSGLKRSHLGGRFNSGGGPSPVAPGSTATPHQAHGDIDQDAPCGRIDGPATPRPSEVAADVRPPATHRAACLSACGVLLLLALLLAGCGGSTQPTHHVTTTAAQQLVAPTPTPTASARAKHLAAASPLRSSVRPVVHRPVPRTGAGASARAVVHRPVPGTGAGAVNNGNRSAADSPKRRFAAASNPCGLVARSEVQAILGGPIAAPVEAPQGPTCIYRPIGDKRVITLSVQSLEFAKLKAQIHDLRPVTVHGRTGYCGSYGQPTVFVPLSSGRVLDVTASCSIATRIASAAVTRLHS